MIAFPRLCRVTCFCIICCTLCSCVLPAKIPFQQTVYKLTYEYLRTAECHHKQDDQTGYIACDRSYNQDFARYQQLRSELADTRRSVDTTRHEHQD